MDDMVSYAYTRGASLTIDFEFSNNVLTAIPQKHAGYIDTSVIERVVIMGLSGSKVEEVVCFSFLFFFLFLFFFSFFFFFF